MGIPLLQSSLPNDKVVGVLWIFFEKFGDSSWIGTPHDKNSTGIVDILGTNLGIPLQKSIPNEKPVGGTVDNLGKPWWFLLNRHVPWENSRGTLDILGTTLRIPLLQSSLPHDKAVGVLGIFLANLGDSSGSENLHEKTFEALWIFLGNLGDSSWISSHYEKTVAALWILLGKPWRFLLKWHSSDILGKPWINAHHKITVDTLWTQIVDTNRGHKSQVKLRICDLGFAVLGNSGHFNLLLVLHSFILHWML